MDRLASWGDVTALNAPTGDGYMLVSRSADGPVSRRVVDVQGSKNCFNHIGAVALAGDGLQLRLDGAPSISDRHMVSRILRGSGLDVLQVDDALLIAGRPTDGHIDTAAGRHLRVSICYAGALAANIGWAVCPFPGGDAFTARPIDLHLRVLLAAGAEWHHTHGGLLSVRFPRRPRAFDVSLTSRFGPSMGASVTGLLVAAQAAGTSTLRGVCPEPEVMGVMAALQALGVRVEEVDEDVMRVHGVDGPLPGTARVTIPPDRIEAATYLIIGALHEGETAVAGIALHHFPVGLREAFDRMGLPLRQRVSPDGTPVTTLVRHTLGATQIETGPHPGFPTDVQPQIATLLTQAHGTSTVRERVYDSRTTHVPQLARLGLRVDVQGDRQRVPGLQTARGGEATVTDIRCGAALLVAAAAADGPVLLHDPAGHLARGYADLGAKLAQFGMEVAAPRAGDGGGPAIDAVTVGGSQRSMPGC